MTTFCLWLHWPTKNKIPLILFLIFDDVMSTKKICSKILFSKSYLLYIFYLRGWAKPISLTTLQLTRSRFLYWLFSFYKSNATISCMGQLKRRKKEANEILNETLNVHWPTNYLHRRPITFRLLTPLLFIANTALCLCIYGSFAA